MTKKKKTPKTNILLSIPFNTKLYILLPSKQIKHGLWCAVLVYSVTTICCSVAKEKLMGVVLKG